MTTNPVTSKNLFIVDTSPSLSVGLRPFLYQDRALVTVMAKVVVDFGSGVAKILPPEPIRVDDEWRRPHLLSSLLRAGEAGFAKAACDVTLIGTAASKAPALELRARMRILRDGAEVLDKTITATGGRDAAGRPMEISAAQLMWEHAVGGSRATQEQCAANPVGTDQPRLTCATSRFACFGPIPAEWSIRSKLLQPTHAASLQHELAGIADGFPWEYFQTAPPDQRVPYLRGDERIVLEGFTQSGQPIDVALPNLFVRVWLVSRASLVASVRMTLDTLAIEANVTPGVSRAVVVFRGTIAPDVVFTEWENRGIVARLASDGSIEPPDDVAEVFARAPRVRWAMPRGRELSGDATMTLQSTPRNTADIGAPFQVAPAGRPPEPLRGTPSPNLPVRPARDAVEETLAMTGDTAQVLAEVLEPTVAARPGMPTYLRGREAPPQPVVGPLPPAEAPNESSRTLHSAQTQDTQVDAADAAMAGRLALAEESLREAGVPEDKIALAMAAYRRKLEALGS
jgi:hypothetical protein